MRFPRYGPGHRWTNCCTRSLRKAHYVSPYQTIDQLLPILRERPDHMAIVVDEFGSAVVMISMEDILEEVVGEIDVGYDFEEQLIEHGTVLVKVWIHITVNDQLERFRLREVTPHKRWKLTEED